MATKCIWCKALKPEEDFENPALGVCRECNRDAERKHQEHQKSRGKSGWRLRRRWV